MLLLCCVNNYDLTKVYIIYFLPKTEPLFILCDSHWREHNPLMDCVAPENIRMSPTEEIFFVRPPQPLFIHFFQFVCLFEPCHPWEIPNP